MLGKWFSIALKRSPIDGYCVSLHLNRNAPCFQPYTRRKPFFRQKFRAKITTFFNLILDDMHRRRPGTGTGTGTGTLKWNNWTSTQSIRRWRWIKEKYEPNHRIVEHSSNQWADLVQIIIVDVRKLAIVGKALLII